MSSEYSFVDLSKYKLLFSIGSGGFSQVHRVQNLETGDFFAAKISKFMLDEDTQDSQETLLLFREVNLMILLNHPAILKFNGYSQIDFENNPCPTIICEFASNGSLYDIIKMEDSGISPDDWNITKKLINIYGIASGMSYMHSHNVFHRDLKPSNILIDDYLYPKISDFGLSKIYDTISKSMNIQSQNGLKGTPAYMAPEILTDENYSKSGDVYAFAFIVFQIMTGEQPFEGWHFLQIMKKVAVEGYRPKIKEDVPPAYRNLIERCWSQKAEERPSFDKIVEELKTNSDFLTELVDELEFFDYVEFIEKYESTFDVSHRIHFEDFVKIHGKNKNLRRVSIKKFDSNKSPEISIKLNTKEIKLTPIMNKTTNNEVETNPLEIKENRTTNLINKEGETSYLKIKEDETINLTSKEDKAANLKIKEDETINLTSKEDEAICLTNKESGTANFTNKENEAINMTNKEEETINLKEKKKYDLLYPLFEFNKLSKSCQNLVEEAHNDSNKQFIVGKSLIECENGFPRNIHLGIQYIKQSNEGKYLPSVLYYIRMLIKGEIIPQDLDEAEKCFNEINHIRIPQIFVLAGKICKKRNKFNEALQCFEQGLKENDNECMYKYAKMLFLGEGIKRNTQEAIRYFNISRIYDKSRYFLKSLNTLNQIKAFSDLNPDTQYIIISNMIKNNQNNMFDVIRIPPNKTEQLFFNKSLKSSSFHKCLSKFQNIFIDLEYPSKSFKTISNLLNKIKNKEKINIQIGICFSSFPIDDSSHCFSSDFSFCKIDRNISRIPKEAFTGCTSLITVLIPLCTKTIEPAAFFKCSSLTTINIPSSVTIIGKDAFSECSKLSIINIPPSVIEIGSSAFSKCSLLSTINIPSSVIIIGKDAFSGCSSLTSIDIPPSVIEIKDSAFMNCTSLISVNMLSSVDSIKSYTFFGCSSLININIPSSVLLICDHAFSNCTSLKSIDIPSVIATGRNAFQGCSSLSRVNSSQLGRISSETFRGCSSLKSIEIASCVKSIGYGIFTECSSLTSIKIPSSVECIEDNAFYKCSSLIDIEIPSSIKSIGKNAFFECISLKYITIPSSVESIGANSFFKCSSLMGIVNQSSITTINENTFSFCSKFKFIQIPSSVTSIKSCAFSSCTSLEFIEIPPYVISIGSNAFYKCSSLTDIEIPSSIMSIGKNTFYECTSLKKIKIPSSSRRIEDNTFYQCSSLIDIEIPSSIKSIGKNAFYECTSLKYITIPSSVESIGANAFFKCSSLMGIVNQSSITIINENAFSFCSKFKFIQIPSSVTSIKSCAFSSCTSLEFIEIPSSVVSIGSNAFYDCKSLKKIMIPSSVTSIGSNAFEACISLTRIEIPSSVKTIGSNAFKRCTSLSNLTISSSYNLNEIGINSNVNVIQKT